MMETIYLTELLALLRRLVVHLRLGEDEVHLARSRR
jgi:hypothetical protein